MLKNSYKSVQSKIHVVDIQRSFAVFTMASILTFVSMIVILATEKTNLTFLQVFFEVMSAFGTCGLSLGYLQTILVDLLK